MANKSPSHPLQDYLDREGISQAEFARKADVSRMTVSRVIRRQQNMTLRMISRFVQASDDVLQATDFVELPSETNEAAQ